MNDVDGNSLIINWHLVSYITIGSGLHTDISRTVFVGLMNVQPNFLSDIGI